MLFDSNYSNSTLKLHCEDLILPPGIDKLVINPENSNKLNIFQTKLHWLLFDYDLYKKLSKCNLENLNDICENEALIKYSKLRYKMRMNSNGRISITPDEYNSIESTICKDFGKIKDSIIEEIKGEFKSIELGDKTLIIDSYKCIFTDASADEISTGYGIYSSPKSPFNKRECLPFSSNNRAETFAVLQAIRRLPLGLKIKIFTDSKITTQRIISTNKSEILKKGDAELGLEIQARINNYKLNGGDIVIEHIFSHLQENSLDEKKKLHLQELKNRYPNNWEDIIKGNDLADKIAKKARRYHPSFKYPPSIYGSRLILQTVQGEIYQSGNLHKMKERLQFEQRKFYKKEKPNQRPLFALEEQKFTQKYDKQLMKKDDHKNAYLQNFMFKVKYNKLLTKSNVRDRAIKYKKTIQSPYEDDMSKLSN